MNDLKAKVKDLFESGAINLFIGYEEGTRRPRPLFVKNAEETNKLVFDDRCSGNLAVYLTRKDLIGGKKVGIAASYYALKSINQLVSENQLSDEWLRVIGLSADGKLLEFGSLAEVSEYLKTASAPPKQNEDELVRQIEAMTMEERWQFWSDELSKCFKCYACRAACPMCYCTKCIVEVNRPQWIQPWATTLSNMEWQINRVMHMAGRCSDCGSCGEACPLGIPIHLLTHKMSETVAANFGQNGDDKGNVLSTFKPEDKENFIL
ncbi:formate dehydrogenase subunit beta [Dysgonomonas sp. PH5-45]|uniref:4Fe-4S dicluster domain-containing protein n=1 Tax=unclassified Dysgonomonas TaxID=2630389 RepID=UPI002475B891|nr:MULTISPECIES: 4Fe-4S dicluster domain-containing protein [unclassified Dysgonomonas]MDH6354412.1 formate dehydrogenase subunit beta [Dysgonomonas sp. PH5-45]MDH6387311.1 formate dehydrogenase subunit beta [Dysgonomonas sp. PH5-37]